MKVGVLSTFENRCFDLADIPMVFKPQTDLAILNFIANHIIQTDRVNWDFVDKHTIFRRGVTDIGYGLRDEHPLQQQAEHADNPGASSPMTCFSSTLLPLPLGPMITKISPGCTVRSTSRSTSCSPNDLHTPWISTRTPLPLLLLASVTG